MPMNNRNFLHDARDKITTHGNGTPTIYCLTVWLTVEWTNKRLLCVCNVHIESIDICAASNHFHHPHFPKFSSLRFFSPFFIMHNIYSSNYQHSIFTIDISTHFNACNWCKTISKCQKPFDEPKALSNPIPSDSIRCWRRQMEYSFELLMIS